MSRSVRYNFILVVVALFGCLAAFGGWRFAKASAPVNGPIVLISVDAMRADRVGAYGYGTGRTPALDALAADGVLFERAYSHVPQTLPAHAALLTGRLPFETGVRDVAGFTVPPSSRTIAKLLRDRGYATGGIVSSFLLRKDTGIDQGFAFFDDERPGLAATTTENTLVRRATESETVQRFVPRPFPEIQEPGLEDQAQVVALDSGMHGITSRRESFRCREGILP